MLERRNSDRLKLKNIWVKEENGDFQYALSAKNLSEDGIFLEKKMLTHDQEAYSKLTFTLPNGKVFRNITARMIREERKNSSGAAFEFLNLDEHIRIELKKFIASCTLFGNA